MHVQSISRWAPPNIGPYSQSNVLTNSESGIMFLAGQIGMDPGTLDLFGSPQD
jgi:diphthine-ammonia ligase